MFSFGTGGWRAVIGDGFNKDNIRLLALAVSKLFSQEGVKQPLVIGYDRRFLSKEAVKWFAEVFCHTREHRLLFINRSVPTPVVMFYTKKHNFDYGMMVTASHNPAIYNGFKLFTKGGKDADLDVTRKVEALAQTAFAELNEADIPYTAYETLLAEGIVKEFNPVNEYLDSIMSMIDIEAIKAANLKLVLDPMYGVSGDALKILLITSRCELEIIHQQHDTLFGGHMPSPSETFLGAMKAILQERQFDAGIATDGDGDRLAILDDRCRYLSANEILALVYYYFLEYKGLRGDVVRNLATTHLLDKIAAYYGFKAHEVNVGFKFVSSAMQETHSILGGESSGGLALPSHINGKDGVFAAMLVIEMLAVSGKKISELLDEMNEKFGKLYMNELELRFREDEIATRRAKIEVLTAKLAACALTQEQTKIGGCEFSKSLEAAFKKTLAKISLADGIKLTFSDNSFVLLRFSGTEPVLRIFAESAVKEETQALLAAGQSLLREYGVCEF